MHLVVNRLGAICGGNTYTNAYMYVDTNHTFYHGYLSMILRSFCDLEPVLGLHSKSGICIL